jgi:hypothetical protein
MYSVAGQEERRKEKSRRRRTEKAESRKQEQKEAGKSRRETAHVRAGPMTGLRGTQGLYG